jgi:hypothetical protein
VEVADILHAQGDRFLERYRASFSYQQLKAFRAIRDCRTQALGGHLDVCPECGQKRCDRPPAIFYNSCRNRHCPKCQTEARQRWLAAREQELLPTGYFHVVFTVPHELNLLALENAPVLRTAVHRQRRDRHRTGARSQASGRRDRHAQHSAHLGAESAPEPSLMMPGITISFVLSE